MTDKHRDPDQPVDQPAKSEPTLVQRLRGGAAMGGGKPYRECSIQLHAEAADRIESLEREVDRWDKSYAGWCVAFVRAGIQAFDTIETAITKFKDRAESAESQVSELRKELAEFDPDPVVCGCREAICPHTPIAKLPRQELVNHYKARIKDAENRAESAEARCEELRKALEHIRWIKDGGVDGRDEHGVFRNFPETERDAMYEIAGRALQSEEPK